MPQRLGYEVNLGSGLESFLYYRSLWALWLTPWEFAGDLGRWNPHHVHRIFRWKKKAFWVKKRQKQFSWLLRTNRSHSLISDPKYGHKYFVSHHSNNVTYEMFSTWNQIKDISFEFWELIKMSLIAFFLSPDRALQSERVIGRCAVKMSSVLRLSIWQWKYDYSSHRPSRS